MPNKTKVYVAVAVAVALTGTVTVSLPAAVASTTACGSACTSPSNESLGTGEVLAVSGSSVVMSAASTSNSAEDWTVEAEGTVTAAANYGVVSNKLMLNYADSDLVEFQYAPDGVPSDKCMADGYADDDTDIELPDEVNAPTLTVTLAQCGVTAASLWLIDQNGAFNVYDDLINAGYAASYGYLAPESAVDPVTSPFAEPAVLTASSSGAVALAPLSEIGGVVSPTQAWTAYTAPDQSALRATIKKSAEKSSG